MASIGSLNPLTASPLARIDAPLPKISLPTVGPATPVPAGNFGGMLDQLVATVAEKQDVAAASTRSVLLGNSENLHQSVIAMQEASVAFSLMVETRNKLVESYQELMRMQV